MQQRLPAVFMRGGTSKGVIFRQSDLPANRQDWEAIFVAVMGSPDPNERQLDGMGGGIPPLSKICVIGPPSRPDADVDYTFVQVSVQKASVDYSANCGNMSSAVGPYAVDEGMVLAPKGSEAVVRIHNTNTNKIIVSHFAMDGGYAAVDGDLALDGVSGTGAAIRLDFLDPAGAKTQKLLPTGNPVDIVDVPELGNVAVSMVDAANPCVFVEAETLGMTGTESPDEIKSNGLLMSQLEAIRCRAAVAMGMARDLESASRITGVPKVAMVARARDMRTISGREVGRNEIDVLVRMVSNGAPPKAVPLTGALCLAVSCRVPGSIPYRLVGEDSRGDIRIGHPSGVIVVAAQVRESAGVLEVPYATVYRTARRLFQGEVLYRSGDRGADVMATSVPARTGAYR